MASSGVIQGTITVGEGQTNQASAPVSSSIGSVVNTVQGKIKLVNTTPVALPMGGVTKVRLIYIKCRDTAGLDKEVDIAFVPTAYGTVVKVTEFMYVFSIAGGPSGPITAVTITALDAAGYNVDYIISGD